MDRHKLIISNNIKKDDCLYRYMSLAQFISMIENRKLFLRKVKLWEDTWESPDDQIPTLNENGELVKSESLVVASTVGQCWTYEKDSDAMWRIYSENCQGIMIETTANDFNYIDNLRYASLSKVIYFNKESFIKKRKEIYNNSSYTFAGGMALKREAFKHENEVRLLICLQAYEEIKDIWNIPVVGFDFEPEHFIKSITLDPRADEWYVETLIKYCASKKITCKIQKSTLYAKDFFETTNIVRTYELIK